MHSDVTPRVAEQVSLAELEKVASEIIQAFQGLTVIVFHGEMGAGKTTFIKAMGKVLGVKDIMSSPTFSIVNEYQTATGERVFHFDFYRIKSETEAYDIGIEEYFDTGDYCLVEWPEKIPSLLPAAYGEIYITQHNDPYRTIAFSIHDGKEKNRI